MKGIDESWYDFAECRGLAHKAGSYHAHFPPKNVPPRQETITECNRCEVRLDCLDYALKYGIREGVWGGKTENQRQRLRRKLRDSYTSLVYEIEPYVELVAVELSSNRGCTD